MTTIPQSLIGLKDYCESQEFKGWDPYDGLSSRVFQATPFARWSSARLAVIQLFKRSPVNFRRLLLVPKQYNAKGIALFLSGYCNLHQLAEAGDVRFGSKEELLARVQELADLLLSLQSKGYSGACWGYGFDWQNIGFYLPRHTPTVVATSFAVDALISAYEITKTESYLAVAKSSADFVVNDLRRIEKPGGLFMFSYSPLDNRAVYNAALLGTKILSLVYSFTHEEHLKNLAHDNAKAVCDRQNVDGSFPHSDQIGQSWRDSFHTGFKLESLFAYQSLCKDREFHVNIEKGLDYWLSNYFDRNSGFCYYYDRNMSAGLVDLHCASQALVTLYKLGKMEANYDLAKKIARWPVDNMQSSEGWFYFQRKFGVRSKGPYMRWPNAWMFYGLSYWMLAEKELESS